MSHKRKRSRPPRMLIGTVLALALCTGAALAVSASRSPVSLPDLTERLRGPRFQLHVVEFLGLQVLHSDELLRWSGIADGVPLIDLDLAAITKRISEHPRVASCVAARIPPDRLLLGLEERVPAARVRKTGEGLDLSGARFPLVPGEADPLAELEGRPEWALPLLRAAQELDVEISRVLARAANDVRFQPKGHELLVRIGDPKHSLEDWLRLRESGLLTRHPARAVDLRFRGRAVLRRLENQKQGGENGAT